MAASRLIAKLKRTIENGGDFLACEEMLTVVLPKCLDDPDFYQLPIDSLCRIVKKREEQLSVEEATKLITKVFEQYGNDTTAILGSFDIGNVGYGDASDIVFALRNIPIIHELLSARPTTSRVRFEKADYESKIEELESKLADSHEEIKNLKRRLSAKAGSQKTDSEAAHLKEIEEKLALLAPLEQDIVEAAGNGNFQIVNYYATLDPDSINRENEDGYTALQMAALKEHTDVIGYLIKHGADVNHKHQRGDTCLHFAALSGNVFVGELLLENGADLNATDADGFAAIHYAAQAGMKKFAKMLVRHGADPMQEAKGTTTFFLACQSGDIASVAFFMDRGVDPMKPDARGYTPLHAAAMGGNTDIADVLIDLGLDPMARGKDGKMPIDVAEDRAMKDFLREHAPGEKSPSRPRSKK